MPKKFRIPVDKVSKVTQGRSEFRGMAGVFETSGTGLLGFDPADGVTDERSRVFKAKLFFDMGAVNIDSF